MTRTLALAVLLAAAPAVAEPLPPQPWLTFTVLRDFEPAGANRVVVWPDRAGRAWLLTLAPPCAGIASARLLGITAAGRRVVAGVDEAVVDGRRCRIQLMERLDETQRAALVPAARESRVVAVRPRPPGEQRPLRPRGGA
jgi:hypothetical protein